MTSAGDETPGSRQSFSAFFTAGLRSAFQTNSFVWPSIVTRTVPLIAARSSATTPLYSARLSPRTTENRSFLPSSFSSGTRTGSSSSNRSRAASLVPTPSTSRTWRCVSPFASFQVQVQISRELGNVPPHGPCGREEEKRLPARPG